MAVNNTGYPNREFLQLAHTYERGKQDVRGWLWSEKLDGMRCFWDGGFTKGLYVKDVPFANVAKTDRYVAPEYATGLWSRYGHPIRAPQWWLDTLPAVPMDGELYMGRGLFEDTMSILRSHDSPDWGKIKYNVFEVVSIHSVFTTGCINNPNFFKVIDHNVYSWVMQHVRDYGVMLIDPRPFATMAKVLDILVPEGEFLKHVLQNPVPDDIYKTVSMVVREGGEGIIMRDPNSYWSPKRVSHMLKGVPVLTDEATVVGFVSGDKGRTGLLGSLVIEWRGKRFRLAGFDLKDCVLSPASAVMARAMPGAEMDLECAFKVGDVITFEYKELSNYGIPKAARYWRRYQP